MKTEAFIKIFKSKKTVVALAAIALLGAALMFFGNTENIPFIITSSDSACYHISTLTH